MSVVIETTLGDITVDLFLTERPRACLNFLKLCKIKYYNYNLFHTISRGFIAQTGDPTGSRSGGESIFGVLDGTLKRYFEGENKPRIKHTKMGLISFVGNEEGMIGSQFFITLGEDLTYLDEKHCVFGEVAEGHDILEIMNEVICDTDDRPYQDVRITHTVILDDPYPNPQQLKVPSRSPSPTPERLQGGRIAPDEEIDETVGKSIHEVVELQAEREAKARATILEMVGDLPDADMAPPENVLFVCKLNPVTTDEDLEIIFNRFGKIKSCEVIRDRRTQDSLQYAFIEFEDAKSCEDAYFKMDNILIDDRRIHVDFSQSVSKVKWHGKGRGVTHYDDKGRKTTRDNNNEIGKGKYKLQRGHIAPERNSRIPKRERSRSKSPNRTREGSRRDKNRSSPKENLMRNREKSRNEKVSRSPQRRYRDSRSPIRKNGGEKDTHRSSHYEKNYRDHIRYRDSSRNRQRSRSPPSHRNGNSRNEASSRSNRDTRYNTKESSSHYSRNKNISTENKYDRYHSTKYDIKTNTQRSRRRKSESSEEETRERKQNTKHSKEEKESKKKKPKKRQESSSETESDENSKKKSKKYSDTSSDSESSESSSESDSDDKNVRRKRKNKSKKSTRQESSESDTENSSRKRNKSKKKKK